MEQAEAGSDADGVLVVSAWTHGPHGDLRARITMSRGDAAAEVRVVASPDDLHKVLDEWLVSLRA